MQRKHVGIYVLPVYYNPSLIGNMSKRQVGKCTFGFKSDDDEMIKHLPDFLKDVSSIALKQTKSRCTDE